MKILDLKEDKIIVSPEALAISFIGDLWHRDKSRDKAKAMKDISYVYYISDFNSPYSQYPETERGEYIKEYVTGKNYKTDDKIELAIREYRKLNTTPSMELLDSMYSTIYRMKDYFKTVDFTAGEGEIDKAQKAMINMPKLMSALNEAREICLKEKSGTNKNRAGYTAGQFEDR